MLDVLGGIATGLGALGSLFGSDDSSKTTQFIDMRNPELMEALEMAKRLAGTGIDATTLRRLRTSQQNILGNELSGQRSAAASRLQRQGVPTQVQEQILSDITQKGLLSRMSANAEMDMFNEQQKLRGLLAYLQGSKGLTQKITTRGRGPTGQGFADLFSGGLNMLMMDSFMGGGDTSFSYDDYQEPLGDNPYSGVV